jgi:hypothetical protein
LRVVFFGIKIEGKVDVAATIEQIEILNAVGTKDNIPGFIYANNLSGPSNT